MPTSLPTRPPPFCPNPDCDSLRNPDTWRFKKKGFFLRDQVPRKVQRYRCNTCGRNFSSQTFRTTYWLRRADLLVPVFHRLLACSGLRQIAREVSAAHSTIQRLAERLGRHCLLFHEVHRPSAAPTEPLVLDGFRTFEHSQYWPMDLNLLVGPSHFVYGFNDAELRRSGTMRPSQHEKRARLEEKLGRPDPQATRKAVEELLRRVVPPHGAVSLLSDEHNAYPVAVRRLRDRTIEHATTSSRASRTPSNPLFAVNQTDHLLRHSSANHKRETIAFSKRRQGALYRAAVFVVWRNYVKSRSENRRDDPPAKQLGLISRRMSVADVLDSRLFVHRMRVPAWVRRCYFGRIRTRAIANCVVHEASYAA